MERVVTPPEKVALMYGYSGTVAFIFDEKGKVLVTLEKGDKETDFKKSEPKKSDQLGVATETREPPESWVKTFLRQLSEEFKLDEATCTEIFRIDPQTSYLGETMFREGTLATVLQIQCIDTQKFFEKLEDNNETRVIGFLKIPHFLDAKNIRLGVRKTLEECQKMPQFGVFNKTNLVPMTEEVLTNLESDL